MYNKIIFNFRIKTIFFYKYCPHQSNMYSSIIETSNMLHSNGPFHHIFHNFKNKRENEKKTHKRDIFPRQRRNMIEKLQLCKNCLR